MGDDFNPNETESYLMYFDINSLYGYAMSEPLPIGGYEWIDVSANNIDIVLNSSSESKYGYLVEADINYPNHLHDLHNDYPFLCQKRRVNESKHEKLILDLNDKKKNTLHYLTLQMAISNGLELKKIHRILRFEQSKWLKPFIDYNTEKRKNAKNEFDKTLYKLFTNTIYGKSIENVRKRCNAKMMNQYNGRYGLKVHIAKPNFKKLTIFNENLVIVEMLKTEIVLDKPIAIGVCVLEISKLKMYNFHYNFMLKEYDVGQCNIMYTDTDSFIYYLKDKNIYDVMKNHSEQFDTSDYSINNPFNMQLLNKKKYGIMKDENNGHIMQEYVGLRAKMYCYKNHNGRVCKRAKGV